MTHGYIFFDIEPSLKTLDLRDLEAIKSEFVALVEARADVYTRAYATLALKARTRFMLHLRADEAKTIQDFVNALMHTALGKHLSITYTLLGITRPSPYNPKGTERPEEDPARTYLIVYPFTKTIEWHLKPKEERSRIMKDHVGVGKKFNDNISQLLLYSYGVDDHEFIVSYQTESLIDFQTLVMELRNTEGRGYTLRDTPIFTCIRKSVAEALDFV
ncbi:MAG TPA: chlorite dismutase family protein [Candidatus Paceibacterota bacterium]|nr:chlorite dismutase family protein [Candidatus Paceibacterota bacterium]